MAEGVLEAPGVFRADTVLAKHDENYMPREVADALKKQGHWQGEAKPAPTHNEAQSARESAVVLVEAGHFALALALGLSLIQFVVPLWGARANDPVLMAVAPATRARRASPASRSPSSR